jgi:hypothetical protein
MKQNNQKILQHNSRTQHLIHQEHALTHDIIFMYFHLGTSIKKISQTVYMQYLKLQKSARILTSNKKNWKVNYALLLVNLQNILVFSNAELFRASVIISNNIMKP